jgi:energy-coupling factor transporter ATP-binding protein EcfA2
MATRIRSLRPERVARLRHGEHLVLYGPRGSGKSTLLAELETRLTRANAPSARSTATNCLNDITRTLEEAYRSVERDGGWARRSYGCLAGALQTLASFAAEWVLLTDVVVLHYGARTTRVMGACAVLHSPLSAHLQFPSVALGPRTWLRSTLISSNEPRSCGRAVSWHGTCDITNGTSKGSVAASGSEHRAFGKRGESSPVWR